MFNQRTLRGLALGAAIGATVMLLLAGVASLL